MNFSNFKIPDELRSMIVGEIDNAWCNARDDNEHDELDELEEVLHVIDQNEDISKLTKKELLYVLLMLFRIIENEEVICDYLHVKECLLSRLYNRIKNSWNSLVFRIKYGK